MAGNTYKATVRYAGDGFFIGTPPSGHAQIMDSKGDRRAAPTPLEMLLVSVAACTALDVQSILAKKRQDVTGYDVFVEADQAEEPPAVFTRIRIRHMVTGHDIDEEALKQAIRLSEEKYCAVGNMLNKNAAVATTYEIVAEKENVRELTLVQ